MEEFHFLIIHKSSPYVDEYHVNEHGEGRREMGRETGEGGAEQGISHTEMRVLLFLFSLSLCITPWITTTLLPPRWRNVLMFLLLTPPTPQSPTFTPSPSSPPFFSLSVCHTHPALQQAWVEAEIGREREREKKVNEANGKRGEDVC